MTQQLCGRDLQILWVATQERDNWAKLMVRRIIKVSYLPYIYFVDLNVVQDILHSKATKCWRGFEESVPRDRMAQGISQEVARISFRDRDCTEDVTRAAIRVAEEAAVGSLTSLFEEVRRKDRGSY
ncbi:hypothetical protein CEP51_002868 [Fusarium floridanum]|uniref:Uncharacterized protein n=1 Tax=Fusarium floridanum TaxID=1325733 RepID=A0A428S941_9HYPO|nr:hypothetical protein CEP51_002868 [Fusarium floridanum]